MHPELLADVALRIGRTAGDPLVVETKVLDIEEEDRGATTLVIACPASVDPLEHHFDVLLSWTYPFGRMECPVTTSPSKRKYGAVWLANPVGPTTRLQQREFFRAAVSVPVHLVWTGSGERDVGDGPDAEDGEAAVTPEPVTSTGLLVDLSEGGLQASLRGTLPGVGTALEATLQLDGRNLVLAATVVRHLAFAGGGSGVALAFADPARHGDEIRRITFEAERRRRRTT